MKAINKLKDKIPPKKRTKVSKTVRVLKTIKNVICWILVAVLAITVITFLLTRVSGGTPSLFGYSINRVETGSMEPELKVGDVLLCKNVSEPSEIKEGDIITFQGGERFSNHKVTHRVLIGPYYNDNGECVIVTKGDANDIDDGEIKLSAVESKMLQKLDFLKKLYDFFFSPWGLIIFIALLVLIFFDEVMNLIRLSTGKYDDEEKEESIGEIIERIQREDAEELKKERYERKKLEDYGEDNFEQTAEPEDLEDPDPEITKDDEEDLDEHSLNDEAE